MKIYDLPLHKDTYFFGYGIDIEKPIEMANQIIKLQQENRELKKQLQQKQDIINKAIKFVKDYKTEWVLNDEVLNDMNKLLEILDNKGE